MHQHLTTTRKPLLGLAVLCLSLVPMPSRAASKQLAVTNLRCEYRINPLGIDQPKPRLSWQVQSEQRGARQTAYQILVASSRKRLAQGQADLWDSGKVASGDTVNVVYLGQPLKSRDACFWKVRVWGSASANADCTSAVASWSMGLLAPSDWKAKYISYRDESPVFTDRESLFLPPARQYRKKFTSGKKPIRRATIYATALGIYELYINGRPVGDQRLAPGWTDYHQRAYYNTYDVTSFLTQGDNAIGTWVADGWYSGYVGFGLLTGMGTEKIGRYTYGKTPAVMLQLEIDYADGTREVITTDTSWKVTGAGPIREADLLMGESYDARKEIPGWAMAEFDDSQWQRAISASDNGHPRATFYEARNPTKPGERLEIKGRTVDLGFKRPKLEAFPGVPVRVTQQVPSKSVTEREPGKYIYDLGQNIAGVVRLEVKGHAGQRITLRYGEMLYPDGRLMTENLRKARATDQYILRGDSKGEVFIPRFTFHGFRYVEVTIGQASGESPAQAAASSPNPKLPRPRITGLVIHSDTPRTSAFKCSDPMANRLFKNVVWTQRANFIDLPTDCPQRDERMGWTGDAQVYVATATYNADVAAFYTKWIRELMESQRPSGAFPGYAPFPFQHGWDFGTAWADAGIICPWTIWQAYGDTRIVKQCWEPMTRFMQWRKRTSRNYLGINHGNTWGDWLTQGAATPIDYIDTIYFAITSRMMAEMADAIGHDDEATAYRKQLEKIKNAFDQKYLGTDGTLSVPTQTAYALALFADVVPDAQRKKVGQTLANMIHKNGNRMTTGFLGTRPLLPVLSSVGQNDLAVFLFQSRAFPSWGYEVDQGATTIWERWDSYTKKDAFGRHNAAMNSFSHYAFGAVCQWMFRTLAGIQSDGPGYKKIIIRPMPPSPGSNAERKQIDWVNASYKSIRGLIESHWRLESDRFELTVTIPTNTTATVYIPGTDISKVTESSHPIAETQGVKLVRVDRDRIVLAVESGTYSFVSSGAIKQAKEAFETSEPPDKSVNPFGLDVSKASPIAQWDFRNPDDVAKWAARHNLKIEQREGNTFLVATGPDPQMETRLDQSENGQLVIQIKALPARGTTVQFFWASNKGNYSAGASTRQELKTTDKVREYLVPVGGGKPVRSLRFDPFPDHGEMRIQTITLYRLRS